MKNKKPLCTDCKKKPQASRGLCSTCYARMRYHEKTAGRGRTKSQGDVLDDVPQLIREVVMFNEKLRATAERLVVIREEFKTLRLELLKTVAENRKLEKNLEFAKESDRQEVTSE